MKKVCDLECGPCSGGHSAATEEEQEAWLSELDGWQLDRATPENKLVKTFSFKNFKQAIAFTDRVAELAESVGHHPVIITEWGKVTVSWWTHKIGGLHETDFAMADRTDSLIKGDERSD